MIFNEIFKLWKKSDLLTQAIDDTNEMIGIAYKMYKLVYKQLFVEYSEDDAEKIKKTDFLLNHFEKSIKKKVFEHVSLNEKEDQDIYSAFLITSIVGDIERIGDYIKNINEVAEVKDLLRSEKYKKILEDTASQMKNIFKSTMEAFKNSDKDLACKLNNEQFAAKSKIDDIIDELVRLDGSEKMNYVPYALTLRYMKRLSAHLMHLNSSITNPIDMIGYYDEDAD